MIQVRNEGGPDDPGQLGCFVLLAGLVMALLAANWPAALLPFAYLCGGGLVAWLIAILIRAVPK